MVSKVFLTVVTSGQQYISGRSPPLYCTLPLIAMQEYNIGEKPTVILYTYNNRHAEIPGFSI